MGTSGIARETSNTARVVNGFSAGPESQPVTGPNVGRNVAASMPIAGGESISVRPCAPARTIPRASSTTSGVDAGNFAKTGIIDIRATAPTISAARSA